MSMQEFLALLVLATAMSFTPGPNTTLSTALAANRGLRGALHFCLAVPALRWAVTAVGVGYMLWLAWQIARVRQLGQADRSRLDVSFLQGVALQFVNIKAWMLALALTAGWVTSSGGAPAANPGERLAIVLAVMAVYAFVSNLTYALVGASLRGWLAQGRRLLWFNRTMAAVLVATALWMLRL